MQIRTLLRQSKRMLTLWRGQSGKSETCQDRTEPSSGSKADLEQKWVTSLRKTGRSGSGMPGLSKEQPERGALCCRSNATRHPSLWAQGCYSAL